MVSKVITKDTKVKIIDINLKVKKAKLWLQFKKLQYINKALEEYIKKKTELIESLEERSEP
jgi:hypothetical protein